MKRTVAFPQNAQSATTTVAYRCSSTECQDRIDAKMAAMTQVRVEREQRDVAKAVVLAEARTKARETKEQLRNEVAKQALSAKALE